MEMRFLSDIYTKSCLTDQSDFWYLTTRNAWACVTYLNQSADVRKSPNKEKNVIEWCIDNSLIAVLLHN